MEKNDTIINEIENVKDSNKKEVVQRKWINPMDLLKNKNSFRTGLMIKNSITNKKNEFVTKDGSKNVSWYICGPTVYDVSHLGHARTYLSFDILRRIFENYFGYNVHMGMNITDIDDKIILKCIANKCSLEEITRKYENSFFDDMKKLNIQFPDQILRVTEHIPEIIKFIEKLIDNKYAYESNGSVYFWLENFTMDNKNIYAKLDPSKLNSTKVNEVDGDLGAENEKDKKSPKDFALWKKAKQDEPNWDSPWGKGRPGWHIECSVLCTQMFGDSLDIHCGGCDLKFPHHDNEIAQSEAYYNSEQWVNYFMHTGHLHIEGSKMSKSLKNFIKIEEILNEGFNANTIRLQFIKHKWDTDMDYNREGLRSSFDEDKKIREFFFNLNSKLRVANTKTIMKFNEEDHKISNLLKETKEKVHSALLDNLNTEKVMILLKELMNSYNIYETKSKGDLYKVQIGYSVGNYVKLMLNSFGLIYEWEFLDNLNLKGQERNYNNFMNDLIEFRTNIRALCQTKKFDEISEAVKNKFNNSKYNGKISEDLLKNLNDLLVKISSLSDSKDHLSIFKICDEIRDSLLFNYGIKLVDGKDSSIWGLFDLDSQLIESNLEKKLAEEKEQERIEKEQEKQLKVSINNLS